MTPAGGRWPGCASCPASGSGRRPRPLQRALGHPDAVSVGDYHLQDLVVHFLTGRARAATTRRCWGCSSRGPGSGSGSCG